MKLASLESAAATGGWSWSRAILRARRMRRRSRRPCGPRSTTGARPRRASPRSPMRSKPGRIAHLPFDPKQCAAPLPRAFGWADGSAYVNHVALVRQVARRRAAAAFWTDPLMYRGASDGFLGPRDPIPAADTAWGIDLEAEVAVIVDRRAAGREPEQARDSDPAGHAGQRRQPAQPHPGRARQGLRLPAEQGADGVLAGRGDAGRARHGLGRHEGSACRCSAISTASRSAGPTPAST